MRVAFFVSSIGDTDLALNTIKAMEQKGPNETLLIALTKTAEQRISTFQSSSLVLKNTLSEILSIENFSAGLCTKDQLDIITQYIKDKNINYAYCGVPSVNNEIPFQIAESLEDTPVLMAYEFMFKPETHCLWKYVPKLKSKLNVQWALPLADAIDDFGIDDISKVRVTGHLSIDNAYSLTSATSKTAEEIRAALQVADTQSLAFVSSTTQPTHIDETFLDCLLTELHKHPNIQVRLGLHPGIQDLDTYVNAILAVYKKHPDVSHQFRIILPNNLIERFNTPALSIDNPELQDIFLRVNVSGSEAAFAADRIAQAVPGALLNQSVIEGKPSYSHSGKPYLPKQYFSNSLAAFFSGKRKVLREKEDLGLNEKTASENYANIIAGSGLA